MFEYLNAHGIILVIAYYVFNAIISGMPEPSPTSSQGYLWTYRSLHTLSGNLDKLKGVNVSSESVTVTKTSTAPKEKE